MNKIIYFPVPKDLCEGCKKAKCLKQLNEKTSCYLKRKPYLLIESPEPDTFKELQSLCEHSKKISCGKDFISYNNFDLTFMRNGQILTNNGDTVIAKRRTYAQMWRIISSLI